jgi:hypothetical protein
VPDRLSSEAQTHWHRIFTSTSVSRSARPAIAPLKPAVSPGGLYDRRRGVRFSRSTAAIETPASLRALHINCFIVSFCSLAVVAIASIVLARTRSVIVVLRSPSGEMDRATRTECVSLNTKRRFLGNFTTSEPGHGWANRTQRNGTPPLIRIDHSFRQTRLSCQTSTKASPDPVRPAKKRYSP